MRAGHVRGFTIILYTEQLTSVCLSETYCSVEYPRQLERSSRPGKKQTPAEEEARNPNKMMGDEIAMARSVLEINMEDIEQEGEDSVIKHAEELTGLKASDVQRDARCFAGALLMAAADEAHPANEPSKEEKDLLRSALCDDAFGALVPGKKQTPAEEEARNPNKMMGDELFLVSAPPRAAAPTSVTATSAAVDSMIICPSPEDSVGAADSPTDSRAGDKNGASPTSITAVSAPLRAAAPTSVTATTTAVDSVIICPSPEDSAGAADFPTKHFERTWSRKEYQTRGSLHVRVLCLMCFKT